MKTFLKFINESNENQSLINRIENFIQTYAKISPNYEDDEDEKYTGPDVYELLTIVDCLKQNLKITRCWSEWGSGCYQPYRSQEGRDEHDSILEEIYKIIKNARF